MTRTLTITAEVKQGHSFADSFRRGAGETVDRTTYEVEYEFSLAEHVTLEDVHHAVKGLHDQLMPKSEESVA